MCWARSTGAWSITRAVCVTPVLTAARTAAMPRVSRPPVDMAVAIIRSSTARAPSAGTIVASVVRKPAMTRAKVIPETALQPDFGSAARRLAPTISAGVGAVRAASSATPQTRNGPTTFTPATTAPMNTIMIPRNSIPSATPPKIAPPTCMNTRKPRISTVQITRRTTDIRTVREPRATPRGLSTTPVRETAAEPAASRTMPITSSGYAHHGISRSAVVNGAIPKSSAVRGGVTTRCSTTPSSPPRSACAATSRTATAPT